MQRLLEKIREILRNKRIKVFFTRTVSLTAAIVVFITTYALVLPAITLEKTASCGIEEHQHDDSCYEEILICGREESDGHQHDDSCYTVTRELKCGLEEHQHSAEDGCYDEEGNLICQISEHSHDDSCYSEVKTLTCGLQESEGHHHTDACYEKVLVCGKEVHTHSEKCYTEDGEADDQNGNAGNGSSSEVLPQEPAPGSDDAVTESIAATAEAAAEEVLPEGYVPELEPINMEAVLGKKTGFYYFHAEEGQEVPSNSAEITDWQKVRDDTELASTDLVRMYLPYSIPAGSLNETNPTARYRLPGNIHLTDDQIRAISKNENGITAGFAESDPQYQMYLGAEAIEGDRTPDERPGGGAQEYISAVVRAENVYRGDQYIGQDLIFTFVPYTIEKNQKTYDAEQNPLSSGEKVTGWFACDFTLDQIDWIEEEKQEETQEEVQEDTQEIIQDESEETDQGADYKPDNEAESVSADENSSNITVITIEKTADILFVSEDKDEDIQEIRCTLKQIEKKEITVSEEEKEEEKEEYQSGTLTAEGDGYKITLDYSEEAKIPENASLSVREITAETDKEAYEACLAQAQQHVDESGEVKSTVDSKSSRFFDIEIQVENEDGTRQKIEPAAPVSVNIQIADVSPDSSGSESGSKGEQNSDPTVLHFAEEGVEQIEATASAGETDVENGASESDAASGKDTNTDSSKESKGESEGGETTEIRFEAESFSIYGVVYTVDFHYEINGKTYDFSIPGGGFVSLEHLVEVLGIASADENTKNGDENKLNEVEVSEATKKFVADVESVDFSSPELVWVGKIEEATTVGGIKENKGLEIEYSAELTEEQIEEINAQTVEAGDWALISMQPFTSEETLTVTMKNGDQFVVRVTDAQKPYKDVESLETGTYIIYNSFDSSKQAVFMKNDGTSFFTNSTTGVAINPSDLSDYTWEVTKNSNGTFTIKSTKGNTYINLWGNDHNKKDQFASSTSANLNLATTSNGITISYGNKMLQRRTSGSNAGFYVHSSTYGLTPLTFYKIEDNPSGGSTGESGIELTDEERAEMEKWKETLESFNTLTDYDKTAEVFNEDNRIYEIDITADSGITDFYKNVDLGLVLDVSNSMKFPSSLKALEDNQGNDQQVWMTADWLEWAKNSYLDYYNQDGCFYIISDPALTSTIYKVWKDGNQWKYQDASENPGVKVYDVNDGTVFKEPYRQAYTLYYADDKTKRMTYLQNSVTYAIDTLKKIVTPTEHVDDNTATVQVAYNFFAGISSSNGDNYAIRKSQDFVNLRSSGSELFTVSPAGNEASGTRQDLALYDTNSDPRFAANEFSWHSGYDKYVILVTDGAPNGALMSDVITAANNLKTEDGVKIITIGLSTKDVDGGSQMLKTIADDIDGDGIPEFYEAEKARDLEYILLRILRSIMAKGIVQGKITDTIDEGFYPVDALGNPLSEGVYNASGKINGAQISSYVANGKPTSSHANEAFYTWEKVGDEWKITWYNQEIGWDDNNSSTGKPWTGTVYVKAKEDYLGGNLIETNDGNAQIEPTGIKLVINGTPETNWRPLEGMTPIDLPVPRVNVHNLETQQNDTVWTVYKGTSVTPGDQIKALWDAIPIEEVVSASQNSEHKITTGASANVGTAGTGETFTLGSLMSEVAPDFDIDTLISQITSSKSSASQEFLYTAYGHESGKITVKVERTVGNQIPATHTADTIGTPVEQYKVTFTYKPFTEAERKARLIQANELDDEGKNNNNYHNGSNSRGTEETGTLTSTNTHTINVFQKGIQVTKIDKTSENPLTGAVFELFRVVASGTADAADVSSYNLPSGTYTKVGDDLTVDSNGIITINPVIPDTDSSVTDKTLYQPNISVGAAETTHDTVFYLVEKTAPTVSGSTYAKMPGAIKFTMTLTENKGTDSTAPLYNWTQTTTIAAEEYGNGSTTYLVADSDSTTTGTNADIYAYKLKNGRATDITLIKTDKNSGASIPGAKFRLVQGSENVDLTTLTITAITGGGTITPEDYDFNGTTIKVVTVPVGGIKIAGLVDDTYTLYEVVAPAGYIITDSGKTFKTENGAIKNSDDSTHANEKADIAFEVKNEPGAALPNTGGPGTRLFTILGSILILEAGVLLLKRRKLI